jgi:predicted exporter
VRSSPRARPILTALAASVLLAVLVFRFVDLRSDMTEFLPIGHTEAAKLMMRELRSGAATGIILIGLEAAPPAELARISQAMAARLDRSGLFALVSNGDASLDPDAERFLFEHRYLLSPASTADAFTTSALHRDFETLLHQLRSSSAPLAQQYGLADPPGAFLAMAREWMGGSDVRSIDSVWFAAARDRALMLARTKTGGLNLEAQDRADTGIRAAFAEAAPGSARLLVAGPAVFARDAEAGIRSDVRLLSVVSTLLVAGLLLWRFRSPLVLAAIAVPILLGLTAAALAVQMAFGFVHAIAFGFGMTMLGVTVDYPVLLIGHRKQGEAAPATLRRIGRAFNLAVASAALGLTGMVFSGLPGLAQIGVFSVVGLLTGALATRWILPRLIVAADLAPVSAIDPQRLLRIERLRDWRLWGLLPAGGAVVLLVLAPPRIEHDLANLSPVPSSARALDSELRAELGAPEVGQVAVVHGATAEAVLQREEALMPVLDALRRDGMIAGAELAARYLPSAASQLARRAALPDSDALAEQIAAARAGLPFRAEAFAAFRQDVAASRSLPPVQLADIDNPLILARLEPLLFARDGSWFGLVAPQGVTDSERLAAALGGMPGVTYVDIATESNGLLAETTARAWRWLSAAAAATLLALAIGLRSFGRVLRVLVSLAAAGAVTVAVLALAGERLSLVHIVALQFVAGVGLDYALFFARRQLDAEERARTLRTLVTCNAMTLLTFGLLGVCHTPLLRTIGLPVAVGAVSALVFAFLFAGERVSASIQPTSWPGSSGPPVKARAGADGPD